MTAFTDLDKAKELALNILESFQESRIYEVYQQEDRWTDAEFDNMLSVLRSRGPYSVLCTIAVGCDSMIYKHGPFASYDAALNYIKNQIATPGGEIDLVNSRVYLIEPDQTMYELTEEDLR